MSGAGARARRCAWDGGARFAHAEVLKVTAELVLLMRYAIVEKSFTSMIVTSPRPLTKAAPQEANW